MNPALCWIKPFEDDRRSRRPIMGEHGRRAISGDDRSELAGIANAADLRHRTGTGNERAVRLLENPVGSRA